MAQATTTGLARIGTRLVSSIAVSSGLAMAMTSSAHAATTQLTWQVSVHGQPFTNWVIALPGDTVTFRLRVSLANNTGAGSIGGASGLAGFNFLPTLTNFRDGDDALPFANEQFAEGSASNPFPGVINHPVFGTITNVYQGSPATFRGPGNVGGTGRNAPWGANGTNTNGKAAPSIAEGVLSWRAGIIGDTGVSLSQLNASSSSIVAVTGVDNAGTPSDTSDDSLIVSTLGSFANNSRNNLIVFSYQVTIGASLPDRTLVASCSMLTPVHWFTSAAGASASTAVPVITNATVYAPVPSPSGVALLGFAGVIASLRRR